MSARAILVVTFLIVVIAACNSQVSSIITKQAATITPLSLPPTWTPSSVPLLEVTSTASPTSTFTPEEMISASSTPMHAITMSPLLTLPPDKAQEMVGDMLRNNGGCQLPCWWGIKPGIATWTETANTLSPFVAEIETYQIGGGVRLNGNTQPEFVAIINYLNNNIPRSFQLTTKDGVVDSINVYDDTSAYRLSALIKSFGSPPFIYVNTVYTSPSGKVPFVLVIYYPGNGILATYITESSAPIQGKNVVFCARDIAPMMLLWRSHQDLNDRYKESFFESLDYWVNDGGLHPIEEVSDSPKSIIDANLKESGCIFVSVELWEKVYYRNKP